jgi:hypothetical protein
LPSTDRILAWAPLLVGLGFLALLISAQPQRALRGQNDFIQLYAGAQLASGPDLYSRQANLDLIQKTHGFTMETVVYTRPPFYAFLLQPLGWLPYPVAYGLYSLASFVAMLWFCWRFAEVRWLAAMGLPLIVTLASGQDTGFVLAILGGAILLLRAGRDFAAGLLLTLLAIKFHLFLFLPLALLVHRRWRVLAGGALGSFGLLLIRVDLIPEYWRVLRDPWIHYSATHMPNLHGLVTNLGGGVWLEGILIGILGIGFVWFGLKTKQFEAVLGLSLLCGMLVSYHSGIADDVVLYGAFVLLPMTRAMGFAALSPIGFVCVMLGPPYSMIVPVLILAWIGIALSRSGTMEKMSGRSAAW